MKTALISLLVVTAMIATGLAAVGPQAVAPVDVSHLSHKQVKKLIATASTAQDHLVLAEYFRREAGKMKQKEQYHLEMAEIYRLHPLSFDSKLPMPMQAHCKYFAEKAHEAANADEELAAAHEHIAQQLSQTK
jgi:hypothetical protein